MAKILIVDDAAFMRAILKNILQSAGHEIVGEAEDGKSGVEQFKQVHPDLVTLDITMPIMNGISALKEIKKESKTVPCIMCSAMGQKPLVLEAIQAGAADFIVKPFQANQVIETVNKVLS